MTTEWMTAQTLRLSAAEFDRLPRNAAYRYEYLDGQGQLTPRPRHYHAILDLAPRLPNPDGKFRPVRDDDFEDLAALFANVFRTIPPYGGLDSATRDKAARQALERTWTDGDGPWIRRASTVALQGRRICGAILITLVPEGDPSDWGTYLWPTPPPANCVERRLGQPHLTWVFVAPWCAGQGIGSALLAASANELRRLGYTRLLTTFLLGNDSSMLWHWRNGFRLLPFPGSAREEKAFGQ